MIYAQGEGETYTVRHARKRLEVHALDLSGSVEALLAGIDRLKGRVQTLCAESRARGRTHEGVSPRAGRHERGEG